MKSSGVEWLGDVPEHWDVRRLKHLLRRGFTNGLFKKKEDFGNGTRLVNVSDIYQADFLIKINTLERVTATEQEVKVFSVQSGDIFFVRSSLKQEGVAASACMLEVPEPTVFESHVVRARPNSSLVIPKYLIYYLNSSLARQRLISLSETTTMTTVAQPKLSSLEVAFPSLAEQHDIVNLIDKRIFDIDELKKQITQSIDLLQKQRTALISAAVTGKIDVREQGN
jgi:type I restriction enzyme S subunit